MKKKIIAALAIILIAVLGLLMALNTMARPLDKNNDELVTVTIEQGSGTALIAQVLKENNIIDNEKAFRIVSKCYFHDGKYQAGVYALSPSMSMKEIQKIIINNETMTNSFTVTEGMTVEKIAQNLELAGLVSYDDFMKAEEEADFDYDFLEGSENSIYRLEGYLYPETYSLEVGMSAEEIIKVMLEGYKNNVDTQKVSRDTLIVASIIEREAGNVEDMGKVASVIYNRLDASMPLQMDSIISYIMQEDKVNLSMDDISVDSDYNPYKNTGLPPGPISSPGSDAINAALNPEDTEYLYFVLSSKLDGSAFFTNDYDEFLEEKEAYYNAYNEKYGEDNE